MGISPAEPRPLRRPTLVLARGLLTLALAGALGCGERPEPPASLVLVTIDTLRADALGVYGGTAAATPVLDRLAAEGVLFEDAVAPMPLTRPSHFTIFTGRYPREHGVVNNQLELPEGELTLTEVLRDAGYRTSGVSGVKIFEPPSGMAQGFADYASPEHQQDTAAQVVGQALDWLEGIAPEERFFLWVHLYDPHMPYAPPAALVPAEPPPVPGIDRRASWSVLRKVARRNGGELSEAAARRIRALYDGEVASVDLALGRLFEGLDSRSGPAPVVAVTADHGECFDHGYFYRHSDCLYEGALRVPLLVRSPGRLPAGGRVRRTVELVDLGAALLSLAGVEPPASFRARDLFADGAEADADAFFQPILSDDRAAGRRQRIWGGIERVAGQPLRPTLRSEVEPVGVRRGHWKYIRGGTLREELYDLAADSAERHNLAEVERRRAGELRQATRRFVEEVPFTVLEAAALSPELRKELEALGYL